MPPETDLPSDGGALPAVTIIVPALNEERFLPSCLDSILAFDYPVGHLEVLIVDGGSADRTREILDQYSAKYPYIKLLDNPARAVSHAMNIGIRAATSEVIVRLDAHATYCRDYVLRSVQLLRNTGASNVGSVQTPVGSNYWTRAVATAMTSRFGVGGPAYRFANGSRWAETAWLGAWRKSTLEEAGGFNEEWVVNQDYELNARLRRSGGTILVSSDLKTQYFVRASVRSLIQQYFRYGMWRVKTSLAYPESVRARQLAPPALVAGLAGAALASMATPWAIAVLGGVYLAVDVAASIRSGLRKAPVLVIVYPLLHVSWGTGFIAGLFRFGIPRIRISGLGLQAPPK